MLPTLLGSRVLYFSPHCDDAAYSSGGFLWHVLTSGVAVEIMTLFSRSAYTNLEPNGEAAFVTQTRKAEDRRFAMLFPSGRRPRMTWLDLKDAPLRKGWSHETVAQLEPRPDDLRLAASLAMKLRRRIVEFRASAVLIPFGFGNHIDHHITALAAMTAVRSIESSVSTFFYEDLPYAGTKTEREFRRWVQAFATLHALDLSEILLQLRDLLDIKRRALACYPSQFCQADMQATLRHARRLGGAERLWRIV